MKSLCSHLRVTLSLVLFIVTIWAVTLVPVRAQNTTGTILGTVTDMSGSTVPDATVQVRNSGTGVVLSLASDAQGRFRSSDLNVGEYEVTAAKMGFSTMVHKGIVLVVGSESVVDFSLRVGDQQQTVTVEGQASQVETTNAAIGAVTTETQMRELPLNGRNFEQLIQLAPGVATVNYSTNAMQGRAAQYSVAGARPEGQAIMLDDESLQSFFNNGISSITGSSLGVEAIAEFQVLTNAYGAQFGGNGAVINAVSRSGTNSFHGSAFDFLRNSALDARDYFLLTRSSPPPFRRNQFGGSIGGPIKKDKAFVFFDYEGVRQFLQQSAIANVPNCPAACTPPSFVPAAAAQAIIETLALYPKPDQIVPGAAIGTSTQFGNNTIHESYLLARFDYSFSPSDSILVRYIADKADQVTPFGGGAATGGGALPFWPSQENSLSQYATIEERHIISPTLVNLARLSYSRPTKSAIEPDHATAPDGAHPLVYYPGASLVDGYVGIPGLSALGSSYGTGHFTLATNRYSAGDDLLWTRGAHSIRMGLSYARLLNNSYNPVADAGVWNYVGPLSAFVADVPLSVFLIVLPTPTATAHRDFFNWEMTPYVQDDWKVTRQLTLNLGLRWEFYSNTTERHGNLSVIKNFLTDTAFSSVPTVSQSNASWHDFDPRVGLAFDPFPDHKTAIRAGFGLFHDPYSAQNYQVGFTSAPPWNVSAFLPGSLAYPTVPPPTSSVSALPAASLAWYWPNHTTPYMIQYNVSIQRQIFGTVLTVGYVGSHGVHLITGIEANPPTPTIDANGVYHFANAAGVQNPRQNPALSYFDTLQPITSSHYNSLQAAVNRRLSKDLTAQVSYVWSKCMDYGAFGVGSFNGSGTAATVENPFNQKIDYGPCSYDITHNFRANAIYAFPFHGNRLVAGWQIAGVLSAYSGVPFNVQDGVDQAAFSSGNVPRPNYISGCDAYAAGTGNTGFPQWFDPKCFAIEPYGTFGNTGRNALRGPGFFNTDISLSKDTRLSERFRLQFRVEFFNIFNHENFALPNNSLYSGVLSPSSPSGGQLNATAGAITATNPGSTPRQIQFGLKLNF